MSGSAPGAGAGPSRETQISIAASSSFPGFRFSPTDEELISFYLKKKMEGCEKSVEVISEVEICRHEPWDLPAKSVIRSENEWFFFSARGRKYPNGSQSRRATELGYWKATGKERNVKSGSRVIGTKRTLVFHVGRAPKGERTEWIMHEYCMDGRTQDAPVICRLRRNTEFRLSDASNRAAAASERQPSDMNDTNHAVSEVGTERDREARRSSSSYDSHSVEQIDSASESNQKLANEATLGESSSYQKDSNDNEEDFYADILKDEIIKLDESAISVAPNVLKMEKSRLEAERESQRSMQAFMLPASIPTMASRRVNFRDQDQPPEQEEEDQVGRSAITSAMESLGINNNAEYNADKDKNQSWSSWFPSCLLTISFTGKTIGRRMLAVSAVFALVLLGVYVYHRLVGGRIEW